MFPAVLYILPLFPFFKDIFYFISQTECEHTGSAAVCSSISYSVSAQRVTDDVCHTVGVKISEHQTLRWEPLSRHLSHLVRFIYEVFGNLTVPSTFGVAQYILSASKSQCVHVQ